MPFLSLNLVHNAFGDFYLNPLLIAHGILVSYISVRCGQLIGTWLRRVSPQLCLGGGGRGGVYWAQETRQRGSLKLPGNSSDSPF